jgi:hypothetical protein
MSATKEDVALGISPLAPSFQNQFRGFLSHWCSTIRDRGVYIVLDVEELRRINENAMYEFIKSRGVVAFAGHAIYDNEKKVIGFIVIEYMLKPTVSHEKIESCLRDKANKVSALMLLNSGK